MVCDGSNFIMTNPTTDRALRLENAELLRALVASVESVQTKQDATQLQVTDIRDRVIGMEARDHGSLIAAQGARITALETTNQRREGATGVIETMLKSPTLGWLVGAITTVWLAVTGRLDL